MEHYEGNLNKNESYFEHNISRDVEKIIGLKQRVFQIMKELEGWCSEQKAGMLIDLVIKIKPKVVVEIGVFGGKSLVPMACALKENKCGKIYGIDPWSSLESAEGMEGANKEYWSKIDHDAILQGLISKINFYNLNNQIELIRSTSENAQIIRRIDMIHIDGNHSEKTSYNDVTKWVPQVKKGGIIIFDDVNWSTTDLAVQWLNQHCTKAGEFHGDNVWGIWIKK